MSREARLKVETALNGDADRVDPALRRSLLLLADHVDQLARELSEQAKRTQRTVIGVGTTIIGALIAAALGTFLQ